MSYEITTQDVWVGSIEDCPGGLAQKLEALAGADIDLEFMISRRDTGHPGKGVAFLTASDPKTADPDMTKAGFRKWETTNSLRVQGPDRAKLGCQIARAVSDVGVNMRGMSASKLGSQAVFHLAFDSSTDAKKAREALSNALG